MEKQRGMLFLAGAETAGIWVKYRTLFTEVGEVSFYKGKMKIWNFDCLFSKTLI